MFLITWRGFRGCTTVSCASREGVFDVAILLEATKTKYKVADRSGLVGFKDMGYGDMDFWQLNVSDSI